MSSIKPPSGKSPGMPTTTEVGGASRTGAAQVPSDAFKKALDEPGAVSSASAARAAPKAGVAGIAQELRAGHISGEVAVQKLVDRALAKADSAGLSPAKRTELEAVLRDALASDPTLSQLSKDLERGR
jgi:hypothetical protein